MKSLLLLCSLLLLACENDHPTIKIIEINKKMVLEEWPDSNYIASLDSILKLEPIKKGKDSADVKLKMNAFKAPTFQLPPSVTGSKNTKKPSANKQGKPAKPGKPSSEVAKPSNNAENFIGKFTNALAALQSDPSNKSLYKVVTANEGEDLFKLLRRTYGAGTQNLPRFYVLSALQSVNAGVMLEHLNAGDKVRVPKL